MQTNQVTNRIEVVDAMRGFALAGIVIAHMIEQYIAAPRPESLWAVESNIFDSIVMWFHGVFVMGKFFAIFSLLFGMSFAIMMNNAAQKGSSFSGRFVWRLLLLMIVGLIHTLFYRGDILTIYVAIGLVLPLFYGISNRVLWTLVLLLCLGAGRYLFFALTGSSTLLDYELSPESPEIISYVEMLQSGTFTEVAIQNITVGLIEKFDIQFAVFGRGYLTFAYFLAGMWLVRSGILISLEKNRRAIKKTLWFSLLVALIFIGVLTMSFIKIPNLIAFTSWASVVAFTSYDIANTALAVFIVCGFLLFYSKRPNGLCASLAPYGRMALSNYVIQSIVGTAIFYGWGLGYLGKIHDWLTFIICFVIITLQIQLSKWWLTRFEYGPLEWLWRCATFFKTIKFKKVTKG